MMFPLGAMVVPPGTPLMVHLHSRTELASGNKDG